MLIVIARFSVPFFFAVSGYFFCKKPPEDQLSSIPSKITKLLKIVCISELCYFTYFALLQVKNIGLSFQCIRNVIDAEFWGYYFKELPARLLVLSPVFNGTLWFVMTLAAIYLLMYGVVRLRLINTLIGFSPVVLLINLCLERILPLIGIHTVLPYNRFILLMPLPFFMLGYAFHLYADRISSRNTSVFLSCISAGLVLSVLEGLLHPNYNLYLGTILTVIGIFGIAVKHASYLPVSFAARVLDHIGANCSLFIYVMHPLIGWVISSAAQILLHIPDTHTTYRYILLAVICAVCTAAAEGFRMMKRIMKRT